MRFKINHQEITGHMIVFATIEDWVRSYTVNQVLLLSNRNIAARPFLYGEDYYMHTLMSKFAELGVSVHIITEHKRNTNSIEAKFRTKSIDEMNDKNTLVILHNTSPYHVCKMRISKRTKVLVPIYFIGHKAFPIHSRLKGIMGLLLWQPLVDEYLVSSLSLAQGLKRLGIIKKINVVRPEYSCSYCDHNENMDKGFNLKRHLPKVVNMVYIGSMSEKRFPLKSLVDGLKRDMERQYKLRIYTASQVPGASYHEGNVEIRILPRRLTNEEKCEILRKSHVFIAPTPGTTMNPSISVIEARFHGNLIATSPDWVNPKN